MQFSQSDYYEFTLNKFYSVNKTIKSVFFCKRSQMYFDLFHFVF